MFKKEFVRVFSPGTFVAEENVFEIESRDINIAIGLARKTFQRYGARPYGFRFETHGRKDNELNSKITDRSPMYYIGGVVRTLEQVETDNKPDEKILLSNMRGNGYKRIVTNTNSYRWTQPLEDDDVVLDITL